MYIRTYVCMYACMHVCMDVCIHVVACQSGARGGGHMREDIRGAVSGLGSRVSSVLRGIKPCRGKLA